MDLTPKQKQALDGFVDGIISLSPWVYFAKLFGVGTPVVRAEKIKLMRHIVKVWEARNERKS